VDSPSQLLLDSRDLTLHAVQLQPSGEALSFNMGQPQKVSSMLKHSLRTLVR
jgi:hypothetical protein